MNKAVIREQLSAYRIDQISRINTRARHIMLNPDLAIRSMSNNYVGRRSCAFTWII